VRYGLGQWPGVVVDLLLEERYLAVCSPRIAGGVPKRPADLARYPLLRSNDEYWQPWFAAAGLPWPEPDRGPIFNDSAHLLQAAIDGHGIALARTSLLGEDVRNRLLVPLFGIEVPSDRRYYFVYPARVAGSARIALFGRWLHDEARGTSRAAKTTRRARSPKR
jgi:LysR family glycine cleavage system transcriptional activator